MFAAQCLVLVVLFSALHFYSSDLSAQAIASSWFFVVLAPVITSVKARNVMKLFDTGRKVQDSIKVALFTGAMTIIGLLATSKFSWFIVKACYGFDLYYKSSKEAYETGLGLIWGVGFVFGTVALGTFLESRVFKTITASEQKGA